MEVLPSPLLVLHIAGDSPYRMLTFKCPLFLGRTGKSSLACTKIKRDTYREDLLGTYLVLGSFKQFDP